MQIRQSTFQANQFKCPFDHDKSEGCLHKHGHYKRYANAHDDTKVTILRHLCRFTGKTISILPNEMLPYWPVSVTEVEDHFDQQSAEAAHTAPAIEAPKRAWNRFSSAQRQQSLTAHFGQRLPLVGGRPGSLWQAIRRTGGSLCDILCELAQVGKSLLGDYRCLNAN
jgi:hypothetical protein